MLRRRHGYNGDVTSVMTMRQRQAIFWLGSYLLLVLMPLFILLLAPVPAKQGFWWDAGIGLGFSALIMLVMQFFITARLKRPAAPFGMDVIYYFHRYLGYALLAVVLGHPLLLVIANPAIVTDFQLSSLSWAIVSGMLALALMLIVVAVSAWRKQLRIPYDIWRLTHLLLALGVAGLALVHLWTIDYYSATPAVAGLWVIIALSLPLVGIQVRLIRPWQLVRRPWTVTDIAEEQGDCWTLTLTPDGHQGLSFLPGQFAWLSLGHSPLAMQEHPFSIASAPRRDGSLQFTIKELGDFTNDIGKTQKGQRAYVDGPYGVFSYDRHPGAPGYVFIAGGIGIAPLIGMIQALADRGDQRHHVMFSAHSEWQRIPRRDELLALSKRLNLTLVFVLEDPPNLDDMPDCHGESGYITLEMLKTYLPDEFQHYQYFMCGPLPMLNAVRDSLDKLQVPATQIHSELFDMA